MDVSIDAALPGPLDKSTVPSPIIQLAAPNFLVVCVQSPPFRRPHGNRSFFVNHNQSSQSPGSRIAKAPLLTSLCQRECGILRNRFNSLVHETLTKAPYISVVDEFVICSFSGRQCVCPVLCVQSVKRPFIMAMV